MNTWTQRTLIGVGAALLVGGWGTTQYAHEERQSVAASADAERVVNWKTLAGISSIYTTGVVFMALGAGLMGFGATRTNKETG